MKCPAKTFVLSVVINISGCASVDAPPSQWPAPVLAELNECPDLSGTYKNNGVDVKGGKATLAYKVIPDAATTWTKSDIKTREEFAAASHLTFFGPDRDTLKIEAWKDKELIGRIERKRDLYNGFHCKDGALHISLPVSAGVTSGIFFDTSRQIALMRANDGSLIVKANSTGVGLGFYVIPVGMYFENWSLYRATNNDVMSK